MKNLLSPDERIIQIMPIDTDMVPPWDVIHSFQEANDDGTDNITWTPIGAALTDKGHIYTLVWDGFMEFKVIDPAARKFMMALDRQLERIQTERKRREIEKKLAEEHSHDYEDIIGKQRKCTHGADESKKSSAEYWDDLTSGDRPANK